MKSIALAALLAVSAVSMPAHADDQVDDIDSGKPTKSDAKSSARKGGQVREVVRGFYVKANAGSLVFFGQRGGSGLLEPGTSIALSLGQDFIDKEKSSAAWELFFHQSLNNGAKYFQQVGAPPSKLIQGDIHTFTGGVAFEYSTYVTRRLGVGLKAGGGVAYVPLLMLPQEYLDVVVTDTWGGQQPTIHNTPLPVVIAGPTLEYYTKLSHFSFGLDAVFTMYLGLDMGVDATGYLKYTF
ncbi:MAG: adventurous gliding motility protein CglE [Alphaproteobacteria bacterium]|nr:adventurous gliding motility protein CglE [Alphaproteobacteria bacterium]